MLMQDLRKDFHIELARLFVGDIQYKRSNYYYYLGKVAPWSQIDAVPAIPTDSFEENSKIRSTAIYVKKVDAGDVSLACRNISWVADKAFAKWDHTKDMSSEEFFVVTDEFQVYKCLDNNGGKKSQDRPVGTSIYPLRMPDGYLWKYMYTIPPFKRSKFISVPNMPVQKALTDSFYSKGSVDNVTVLNSGSGYTDAQLTVIQIAGTTTGTGGSFSIAVNGIGKITEVSVIDGGTGYTKGANLNISSATGVGASITPVIVGGIITAVTVVEGGVGYNSTLDSISAVVGGAVLVPNMSRIDGSVKSVTIVNPGIGYVAPPVLTLVGAGGVGTGAYEGNTAAILDAIEDKGSIVRVTISDPGKNYPVDTDTSIVVQGDGNGAVFSPVVFQGEIIGVVVENSGSGYSYINLTVVGSGSGAVLSGVVTQSDYISDQSIIEQTTVRGAIYAIEVSNQGDLYSDQTTVTVAGDGTGCTAEPIIENQKLVAIRVTNYGVGYTYANVTISDTLAGVGASAYAILPPRDGHGYDAIFELGGDTVVVNTSLRNGLISREVSQDFRQFGFLKDPRDFFTGKPFSQPESILVFKVTFSNVDGLVKDEVLLLGNTRFIVVDIDGMDVFLQSLQDNAASPVGDLIAETNPSRQYVGTKVVYAPNLNKYTGSLLYVSNEAAFSFSEEQGITVKTFIKF
jgi:hypothetical protein